MSINPKQFSSKQETESLLNILENLKVDKSLPVKQLKIQKVKLNGKGRNNAKTRK